MKYFEQHHWKILSTTRARSVISRWTAGCSCGTKLVLRCIHGAQTLRGRLQNHKSGRKRKQMSSWCQPILLKAMESHIRHLNNCRCKQQNNLSGTKVTCTVMLEGDATTRCPVPGGCPVSESRVFSSVGLEQAKLIWFQLSYSIYDAYISISAYAYIFRQCLSLLNCSVILHSVLLHEVLIPYT